MIVTTLAGLVVCADAYAQRPRSARGTLDICHGSGEYVLRPANSAATEPRHYEDSIILDLRADEALRVRIVDPNPLLFNYRAGPIERVPTANYETLTSFGDALARATGLRDPLILSRESIRRNRSVEQTSPTGWTLHNVARLG